MVNDSLSYLNIIPIQTIRSWTPALLCHGHDNLTGYKNVPMKNCWKFLFTFPASRAIATWSKINAFFSCAEDSCTFIIFLWTNIGKTVAIDKMYIKIYYIN